MSPLVLLSLLVVSQTHSRWAASVRAEVRARSAAVPQDSNGVAAADAELRPSISGAIFDGPWTLSGSYTPTLRSREPYSPRAARQAFGEHSHAVQADCVWAKEAAARASLVQALHYGTLDLTTLARADAAVGVPAVTTDVSLIRDLSTDTGAAVDWYLRRTVTLTTSAGFFYGGGADEASRVRSPLQATVRGGARLAVLASPRDTVGVNLGARYVRFFGNPGARIAIAELVGSYARRLAPLTSVDAGLGLTGSFGQVPNPPPAATPQRDAAGVAPYLSAGLWHRTPLRSGAFDYRLSTLLAPFVDRFGATAYQRFETNASLGWTQVRGFNASVAAGAARSLPTAPDVPLSTFYGEANAGYAPDPWWRLDLVSRLSLLQSGTSAVGNQWVIGLSLTLMAASQQAAAQPPGTPE